MNLNIKLLPCLKFSFFEAYKNISRQIDLFTLVYIQKFNCFSVSGENLVSLKLETIYFDIRQFCSSNCKIKYFISWIFKWLISIYMWKFFENNVFLACTM